jgi:hypothetical protein
MTICQASIDRITVSKKILAVHYWLVFTSLGGAQVYLVIPPVIPRAYISKLNSTFIRNTSLSS